MREIASLFPDGGSEVFAVLAQVLWLLQIALIIHVYRTGRPYWWILVLLMAPLLGGLAYFFIELLPGLKSPRGFFYALKPKKWRIADLREELAESETVVNRISLAEQLYDAGEIKEAHEVAAGCLKGVFKNDPRTMVDVARYSLALADYSGAYALLERVDTTGNRMLGLDLEVLKGDALYGLGRYAEAEAAYQNVREKFIGEAPRAGIALTCEKTGRATEAAAIWKEIRIKYRKTSPAWRKTELKWYKLATAKLKAQPSGK